MALQPGGLQLGQVAWGGVSDDKNAPEDIGGARTGTKAVPKEREARTGTKG